MPYTISEVIVLFFTYSVVGWLWETVYCSLKDHQYAYRGFLFGPYCPVYGFTHHHDSDYDLPGAGQHYPPLYRGDDCRQRLSLPASFWKRCFT